MVKLSIITPCSRPYNLPSIYNSILELNTNNVEWIIVFDGIIDDRILTYEQDIKITLRGLERVEGNSYASSLRNEGLKYITGDYIYYLDDDNLIHNKLYDMIMSYKENDKVLIVNQYSFFLNRRINNFNVEKLFPGYIDTAQFIIPSKYSNVQWVNKNEDIDEYPYLVKIINECGKDNVKFINKIYSYRNMLRRL